MKFFNRRKFQTITKMEVLSHDDVDNKMVDKKMVDKKETIKGPSKRNQNNQKKNNKKDHGGQAPPTTTPNRKTGFMWKFQRLKRHQSSSSTPLNPALSDLDQAVVSLCDSSCSNTSVEIEISANRFGQSPAPSSQEQKRQEQTAPPAVSDQAEPNKPKVENDDDDKRNALLIIEDLDATDLQRQEIQQEQQQQQQQQGSCESTQSTTTISVESSSLDGSVWKSRPHKVEAPADPLKPAAPEASPSGGGDKRRRESRRQPPPAVTSSATAVNQLLLSTTDDSGSLLSTKTIAVSEPSRPTTVVGASKGTEEQEDDEERPEASDDKAPDLPVEPKNETATDDLHPNTDDDNRKKHRRHVTKLFVQDSGVEVLHPDVDETTTTENNMNTSGEVEVVVPGVSSKARPPLDQGPTLLFAVNRPEEGAGGDHDGSAKHKSIKSLSSSTGSSTTGTSVRIEREISRLEKALQLEDASFTIDTIAEGDEEVETKGEASTTSWSSNLAGGGGTIHTTYSTDAYVPLSSPTWLDNLQQWMASSASCDWQNGVVVNGGGVGHCGGNGGDGTANSITVRRPKEDDLNSSADSFWNSKAEVLVRPQESIGSCSTATRSFDDNMTTGSASTHFTHVNADFFHQALKDFVPNLFEQRPGHKHDPKNNAKNKNIQPIHSYPSVSSSSSAPIPPPLLIQCGNRDDEIHSEASWSL